MLLLILDIKLIPFIFDSPRAGRSIYLWQEQDARASRGCTIL